MIDNVVFDDVVIDVMFENYTRYEIKRDVFVRYVRIRESVVEDDVCGCVYVSI